MVELDTIYMAHGGGTKWYEMVVISHKGQSMLLKRYGPNKQYELGGGQVIISRGSKGAMVKEVQDMTVEKSKVRSGHIYEPKQSRYGLHNVSRSASWQDLKTVAHRHYGGSSANFKAIVECFGYLDTTPAPEWPTKPAAIAELEPVRDSSWGSW